LNKNPTQHVGLVQSRPCHHIIQNCSPMILLKNCCVGIKQQSLAIYKMKPNIIITKTMCMTRMCLTWPTNYIERWWIFQIFQYSTSIANTM